MDYKSVFTNLCLELQQNRSWIKGLGKNPFTHSLTAVPFVRGHRSVFPRTPRNTGVYTRHPTFVTAYEGRVDTASGKTLKKQNACSHAVRHAVEKKITCIHGLRSEGVKKAHKFLSPTDCITARFYLLPKVHKPGNLVRPIISGNGSPTEHISLFVDSFLKPLVPRISSYIYDTPDFLRRILGIQHQVPSTAIIGTFDVSSLSTPTFPTMKGLMHAPKI